MSSSMQIAEAWAVASCVNNLIKEVEDRDLVTGENENSISVLHQSREYRVNEIVKDTVDSIVSVVSDTPTQEAMFPGAYLYWDGEKFEHSIDCECVYCSPNTLSPRRGEWTEQDQEDLESVLSTPPVINSEEPTNVRRRLFDDEETLIDESVLEDRQCEKCGIYESDAIENNPECPDFIDMGFAMRGDGSRRTMCIQCFSEMELIETRRICGRCGGEYDESEPCECGLWFLDRDGDITYIDEYENEELPENNTEKVRMVKDSVKEMGEFVYDLQEKLSEGEYLKLMDQLQKITNSVNNL